LVTVSLIDNNNETEKKNLSTMVVPMFWSGVMANGTFTDSKFYNAIPCSESNPDLYANNKEFKAAVTNFGETAMCPDKESITLLNNPNLNG